MLLAFNYRKYESAGFFFFCNHSIISYELHLFSFKLPSAAALALVTELISMHINHNECRKNCNLLDRDLYFDSKVVYMFVSIETH